MNEFHNSAIFWVDTEKIKPNPYQPRKVFDEEKLNSLADSIRQYGVLQPLVVTRQEKYREDGSMTTEYELIAGERRLRAARIAGVKQVPAVIRSGEESENVKLELAIIENLQREDLNPIDRALAFDRLVKEFGYKHGHVAKKVARSREYVSNSIRLLQLPEEMLQALTDRRISEGHARPLLMLGDKPEEQGVLFREIMLKKMTVRDAEAISRRIATEKVRKGNAIDPAMLEMEREASENLGTRVRIAPKNEGGKITIDFSSEEDLRNILAKLQQQQSQAESEAPPEPNEPQEEAEQPKDDEDDLYSIKNFSV